MPGLPHAVGQRRLPPRRSCVLSWWRGVSQPSYAFLAYFPGVLKIDMARSGPLGECITVKRRLNGNDFARGDCTFLDQCIERRRASGSKSREVEPASLVRQVAVRLRNCVDFRRLQNSSHAWSVPLRHLVQSERELYIGVAAFRRRGDFLQRNLGLGDGSG